MGLMIHSLGQLPTDTELGYYIYLLDYGWDEPIADALRKNFHKMAELASSNDAVVLKGFPGTHFEDEVLSWHHINGQPSEELLPAILVTTRHPDQFRQCDENEQVEATDKMLLIPVRKECKSPSDVLNLIEKIFRDIREKKALNDFKVAKELSRGKKGAIVDTLILKPNAFGVGIDLNNIINFFLGRKRS